MSIKISLFLQFLKFFGGVMSLFIIFTSQCGNCSKFEIDARTADLTKIKALIDFNKCLTLCGECGFLNNPKFEFLLENYVSC
jgi:hypothetical protein